MSERPITLRRPRLRRLAALAVLLWSLGGCVSLPSLEGRTETAAIASVAGAPIPDALAAPLAAIHAHPQDGEQQQGQIPAAPRLGNVDDLE